MATSQLGSHFGYERRTLQEHALLTQSGQSWTLSVLYQEFSPGQSLILEVEGEGDGSSTQERRYEEDYLAVGGLIVTDTSHETREYDDAGFSDVTTILTFAASGGGMYDSWTADFVLIFENQQTYDRSGLWTRDRATDGTVTLLDGAQQTVTRFSSSDFTFHLSGAFGDGDVSGTFDVEARQLAVSTSSDHQATENGQLVAHVYSDGRTNVGSYSAQVAAAGDGFSFSYSSAGTHTSTQTRSGTLAAETLAGSDETHGVESVSSTRIDAAGNAETTGSQWTNDRVRNYSFTRQFSGTLPHRATTGVDVASFHERHDYETVDAGGTSTGYTQTDYQNGQLVTTSGSGWPSSGSGSASGQRTRPVRVGGRQRFTGRGF